MTTTSVPPPMTAARCRVSNCRNLRAISDQNRFNPLAVPGDQLGHNGSKVTDHSRQVGDRGVTRPA
jgi:hypothetical protein